MVIFIYTDKTLWLALVEYKKLDFEKDDDEDEEEIYYAGEGITAKSVESQGETLLQSSLRC